MVPPEPVTKPPPRTCPICGEPAGAKTSPFCSRRCANIDLLRWLDGRYRVPTGEAPAAEEADEKPPRA